MKSRPMQGFRFTLRGMMAAIALVAIFVALFGQQISVWCEDMRLTSLMHQQRADEIARDGLSIVVKSGGYEDTPEGREEERRLEQKRAAHKAALVQKYRRAARYPWLPVEPDTPEP